MFRDLLLNSRTAVSDLVLLGLCVIVSPAFAERGKTLITAKPMVGLGGESEVDDLSLFRPLESNMETSMGFGVQGERVLHPHFNLGGILAIHLWNTSKGDNLDFSRSTMVDIAVLLKGKYPLLPERKEESEIYLAVPIGGTFNFMDNDWESAVNADIKYGSGFNYGVLIGAHYFFNDRTGTSIEIGPYFHSISHEAVAFGRNQDFNISIRQTAVNLGLIFKL